MPTVTLDNREIAFTPGETLRQVATRAGIIIPTLCHLEGIEAPTSCFVCVVKIKGRSALAPSCATLAEEGMIVESETEEVRQYRRRALELLLSEHAGDCEGPCRRICPADLDIPVMARQLVAGEADAAYRTLRERLALPGVLGHICPAPCQKGCVRAALDGAVAIRDIHKHLAAAMKKSGGDAEPKIVRPSGKRVTIIGAGPAGLSAAYYLSLLGHACTIIDEQEEPGGMLRYGCDRDLLPLPVLEHEIALIHSLGVTFEQKMRVEDVSTFEALLQRADALLLATGTVPQGRTFPLGLTVSTKGIVVDHETFETSHKKIFACGNAIASSRLAVRAVGQGRLAAAAIHAFLTGQTHVPASSARTDSRVGKLEEKELRELAVFAEREAAIPHATLIPAAARCLQCDCGKKAHCALRDYSQAYQVDRDRYRTGRRKQVKRLRYPSGLVHEPGKCIDCGRCVGITVAEHVEPGLAFNNRGFEVAVTAPFHLDLDMAMAKAHDRCVAECPVGALWV